MSNYNDVNTTILATCKQAGGNTRMLLLHVCDSGRHEYVVGSYFTIEDRGKYNPVHYSWDWGHYFQSVVDAVDYWKREVLRIDEGWVRNRYGRLLDYDTTVGYMDDELREDLHFEYAPCTVQEFFDAYCERHEKKFGEPWEFDKPNPVI